MKKIFAAILSAAMLLSVASCGASDKTDWEYIEEKGTLVAGITLFEPMNYYDENGELTGFETEFTKAVCEKLGVKAEFQVIDWQKKEVELKSKTIDAIWNGLTVTEERKENMAFSTPYVKNKQVAVIKAENAEKYKDLASMAGASMTAEDGSAGQTAIQNNEILSQNSFIASAAQKDVLMEVKAGTTEIGVLDYVMARTSIGEGTDYSDLMIVDTVELAPGEYEEYAIGLRLEDTVTLEKINKAIEEMVADGTLKAIIDKYNLGEVYALGN